MRGGAEERRERARRRPPLDASAADRRSHPSLQHTRAPTHSIPPHALSTRRRPPLLFRNPSPSSSRSSSLASPPKACVCCLWEKKERETENAENKRDFPQPRAVLCPRTPPPWLSPIRDPPCSPALIERPGPEAQLKKKASPAFRRELTETHKLPRVPPHACARHTSETPTLPAPYPRRHQRRPCSR